MNLASGVNTLKALARLEVRKLGLTPIRTLLTSLLIAIPVAAIVSAVNIFYVIGPTGEERARSCMGRADLRVQTDRPIEVLRGEYPSGTVFEPIGSAWVEFVVSGRRLVVQARYLNSSGLAEGMVTLLSGRMPTDSTEVAVTTCLLEYLGITLGDQFEHAGSSLQIVGVVENPESLNETSFYHSVSTLEKSTKDFLVKLPPGTRLKTGLPNQDMRTHRRTLTQHDGSTITIVFLIGCLALFEAALIVAAAFIVGVRRRQREIGLLASCGATPRQVFVSLMFSAILISLLAGLLGTLLGLLFAWAVYPWLDSLTGRRNGPFEVYWYCHAITVFLGIVVSMLSVAIPAWVACRMPIKLALSARSLPGNTGRRWLIVGVACVVVGGVLVLMAQGLRLDEAHRDADDTALWAILWGSILGIFGLGMCSPWVVACASKLATKLPVSWRLAVREIGRFRARNATMVTAILAAMALSVLSATLYHAASTAHERIRFRMARDQIAVVGPSSELASRKILELLGGSARAELRRLSFDGDYLLAGDFGMPHGHSAVAVGGLELLAVIGVDLNDRDLIEKFNNGHVLILNGSWNETVEVKTSVDRETLATLPACSLTEPLMGLGNIRMLVSPKTVESYQWTSDRILWNLDRRIPVKHDQTWIVKLDHHLWATERNRALGVASEYVGTSVSTQEDFDDHPMDLWGMLIASLITGLVIVAIANALAGEEARIDQRILLTTGAPPRVMCHQAAARSGILTLIGCVLAVPAGLLPAYGLISINDVLRFDVHWTALIAVVIAVPSVAYVVTLVFAWLIIRAASRGGRHVRVS